MNEEESLKKTDKKKPLLEPDPVSDMAYGIKLFGAGMQKLTKMLEKPSIYEHNEKLIANLKKQIAAEEKLDVQYKEYQELLEKKAQIIARKKAMQEAKKNKTSTA